MADFATRPDVETVYGGSSLPGTPARTDYLLKIASARLRILLPTLEAAQSDEDIASLTKDIVVQAVIRRLPVGDGSQQVQSQTQTTGPWSTTVRYTEDRSETFPDDDLALLREALNRLEGVVNANTSVGTIKLNPVDWVVG